MAVPRGRQIEAPGSVARADHNFYADWTRELVTGQWWVRPWGMGNGKRLVEPGDAAFLAELGRAPLWEGA